MTLTSKYRVHSLSGMSKKSCGPYMPTLLTSMSQAGSVLTRAVHPAATAQSAAVPRTSASGAVAFTAATACCTDAEVSPLTTTAAPQCARPRADGQTNTAGRASDDGCLTGKVDLHRNILVSEIHSFA